VRTIHGDNKSSPAQMGITHKQSDAEIAADLKRHFDLTPQQLKDVLP
jgi:hypothetical protein